MNLITTKREQIREVLRQKQYLERVLQIALRPWVKEISSYYRVGDVQIREDEKQDIYNILRKFYDKAVAYILGYDVRQYKQNDFDPFEAMREEAARQMQSISYVHNLRSAAFISQTASGWVKKVTELATTQNITMNEARQTLINHLKAHTLTIATTETGWITEATRNVAVMLVNDPLKDSVIQIADLIQAGDNNAAIRLSRRVMKLAKQPLSISQGRLLKILRERTDIIGARAGYMTPIVQGRIVANLQERANALGKPKKEWSAIFRNTRDAHKIAEGQQRWVAEPFSVGGELLQYPGDASLGASLGNIINCRCASIHI